MSNWWKSFLDGLFEFFERLGSEKTQKTLEGILRLVLLGCQIVEKFNAPMSGAEKAAFVRSLVRMVKYASLPEIEAMATWIVELKRSGEMDDLQPWEIDKAIGDGTAIFMRPAGLDGLEEDGMVSGLKAQY